MSKQNSTAKAANSSDLIYQLDGRPSLKVAIPLGLQHVLAMFVGNLAPIFILTGALGGSAGFPDHLRLLMIQSAMLVSGLVTLVQLYPLKLGFIRIGARLPIVMGTAFAFVPTMQELGTMLLKESLAPEVAMGYILGGAIVGSIVEILIGLFLKKLKHFFPPLVIGSVLVTIGVRLLTTGANYFVGGSAAKDAGAVKYWIVGGAVFLIITLINRFGKGMIKATAILIGIVAGYLLAIPMGLVTKGATIATAGWISLPLPLTIRPLFRWDIIVAFAAVYVVSGLETMGNTSGITIASFNRDATTEETSGAILADAVGSLFAAVYNTLPNTAFGQNAGIVAMTKVINRFCVACGAAVLILAALVPKVGAIFNAMPDCVMGGAVITVFAMILINGIKMLAKAGLTDRNTLIVAITFGLGYGVGMLPAAVKERFPAIMRFIFTEPVAAVCIVSILACLVFKPDRSEADRTEENATAASNA